MNNFEEFLKYEKINSDVFLKSQQILDRSFDEKEYTLLSCIWKDQTLIDKIFEVIDSIIKIEKIKPELRFLIIGDFIFSLTSYELIDPAELIFKTTRYEYLKRIKLRSLINIIFECDWITYVLVHQKLLIGLRQKKILTKTQIRTISKRGWETTIYINLEIKKDFFERENFLGISEHPFVLINLHNNKYSIGSFRNIWKVKRKKKEMENNSISYESIIKANQIPFYLSDKLYEINKDIINDEKNKILKKIECENLDEYFTKIKNIIKNKKYTHKLLLETEKDELVVLRKTIKKEYTEIIAQFQKVILMKVLEKIKFNIIIYLPCFADNRGRQYYSTFLSPTFHILFRYLYAFKIKKFFINLEISIFYKRIIKYKDLVKEFSIDNEKSYILLILFIEVGKFFIKNSNEYVINTEKIINTGISKYKLKDEKIKFEEQLYLKKIYFLINSYIEENKIDINAIIFKDATASGLQNYGLLLGYKEDKLTYLNINGEDWCDTYLYIIKKFLKTTIYNKRKYWKGTIMTIPYNASWYACFINFLEALRKDNIEYRNFTQNEKKEIKEIHKNFYNKLKTEIKNEFYTNEVKEFKEFKYNKWDIVNFYDYKINYNKSREKYRSTLYMITEDKETSLRAIEANNMHYLDSQLVKIILKDFDIISVHDCFGIRLCELHLIMDKINKYYSEQIKIDTYSIHIIL